jgi:hypothetical protein
MPVALITGWTAMRVVETRFKHGAWHVTATYDTSTPINKVTVFDANVKARPLHSFRPAKPTDNRYDMIKQKDTPIMTKDLYTWTPEGDTKPKFGHRIGTMANGQWVMECKGSDAPDILSPGEAELVLPYTIRAREVGNRQGLTYLAKEGDVSVGDLIVTNEGQFLRVEKINTKARNANTWITGLKLTGTPLTPAAGDEDLTDPEDI